MWRLFRVTPVVRQKWFILDIYGNRETRRRRLISMKWISYGMQSPITHTLALFDSCLYLIDANASFTSHKHTHRSIFMNFHLKYMLSLLLQNTFHIFPFFFFSKTNKKKRIPRQSYTCMWMFVCNLLHNYWWFHGNWVRKNV